MMEKFLHHITVITATAPSHTFSSSCIIPALRARTSRLLVPYLVASYLRVAAVFNQVSHISSRSSCCLFTLLFNCASSGLIFSCQVWPSLKSSG